MNLKQMGKTSLKYTKFQSRRKGWGQNAFGVFIKGGLSHLTDGSSSSGSLEASALGAGRPPEKQLSRARGCYPVSKAQLLKTSCSN